MKTVSLHTFPKNHETNLINPRQIFNPYSMKRLEMLFLVASLSTVMIAQEVTVDAAKGKALQFLSRQSASPRYTKGTSPSTDLSLAYTATSEGKTCFYIFNVGDDNGFVIAGGDEAAKEILGYSDRGSFDYDKAPDNFKWWLSQYTAQIAHAEAPSSEALAASAAYRAKAATTRQDIGPLVQTEWHQNYPYNSQIPIGDGSGQHYVTGCVATAMAQVMKYWSSPTHGTGSYSDDNYSVDFENTTYDWSHMRNTYTYNQSGDPQFTEEEARAVGTLMYHAGVSVRMDYGIDASSAFGSDVGPALAKYFGYDQTVRQESRTYYTDEGWEDLIYDELLALRPVLYSGTTPSGTGHEFVCDGYDATLGMFHINWGWGGYCNNYFTLSGINALKPDGTGTGGGGADEAYTDNQEVTVNVIPNAGGVATPHIVLPIIGDSTNPMYMEVNNVKIEDNYSYDNATGSSQVNLTFYVMNSSCIFNQSTYFPETANVNIQVGAKVVDREYGFVQYFNVGNPLLLTKESGRYRSSSRSITIDLSQFEYNGTYELHPVFHIVGSEEWNDIQVPVCETIPTVTITGAKTRTPVEVEFSISSSNVMIGETVQITHDSNYQGTVTYSSSNTGVATVNDQGVVTGVSEGTAVITANAAADPDRLYLATTTTFEVHVVPFMKADLQFAIDRTTVDVGDFIQISWPTDYDGELTFTSSDPTVATIDAEGKITGEVEGTVQITAHAAESPHYFECQTTFTISVIALKFTFVEPPHFNNNDNVFRDDMVLYYQLRNDCGVTHDVKINAKLQIKGGTTRPVQTFTNVPSGSVVSGSIDFGSFLTYLEGYNIKPDANTEYTVELYMSNGQPFEEYPSVPFIYRNTLTVNYGVSPAGYGTLILPFNAELLTNMKVYSCSEINENNVLMLQEESSIKRNVPYIVTATYEYPYQFVGPEAIDASYPTFSAGILVGAVANNVTLESGTDYILQYRDDAAAFYRYDGKPSDDSSQNDEQGRRLAAQFRAFLRLPSSSNAPKVNLPGFSDDDTEGISILTNEGRMPAGIYSLDGKRLSSFQKGLNILIFDDGTIQKVFNK